MIAQLLFAAKSQFFDNNGDVMTLGSVDITFSLTAEPAPTYKDSAKTVLNDAPIQLTAAGKADIYLDAGSYNIVTRNREGVVVDTTNNFVVSDHAQVNIGGNTPIGGIIMYAGLISEIPEGWHLCDGSGGTPPLQDRFIKGTVYQDNIGDSGGSSDAIITAHTHWIDHTHEYPHLHNVPAHDHTTPVHVHTISHNHSMAHTHSIAHNHDAETETTSTEAAYEALVEAESSAAPGGKDGFTYAEADSGSTNLIDLTHAGSERAAKPLSATVKAHDHTVSINLPNFTGNSGSTSEGSTGGSSTPNTGSGGDATTGIYPDHDTDWQDIETTEQASLPESATSGESGVGKNDPEYYTLAYIMRMA